MGGTPIVYIPLVTINHVTEECDSATRKDLDVDQEAPSFEPTTYKDSHIKQREGSCAFSPYTIVFGYGNGGACCPRQSLAYEVKQNQFCNK